MSTLAINSEQPLPDSFFQFVSLPERMSHWSHFVQAHQDILETANLAFTAWHISPAGFQFLDAEHNDITDDVIDDIRLRGCQLRIFGKRAVVVFFGDAGQPETWIFFSTCVIR
jgi:hypothetical protein